MNAVRNTTWRRAHYSVPAPYLLHLLGINDRELVSVTMDPISGDVTVITSDPGVPESLVGPYVEPKQCRITQTLNDKDEVIAEAREWI